MAAVVTLADRRIRGNVERVLEARPILFLGRVSYGIYLYHSVVFAVLVSYFASSPILGTRGPAMFLVGSVLTVVTATMSWSLIEDPINRLKRLVPYSTPKNYLSAG
jgi:peptidoglycan/LPS O-acetylase OafA/YrhL